MNLVAWIHTEGVILLNQYYVLELAYEDVLGCKKLFLIKSPMSYYAATKINPHLDKSCEVILSRQFIFKNYPVYTFTQVLNFLWKKFKAFGSNAVFGYKGKSFQYDILKKANIPAINLETLNMPSIATLKKMFPNVKRQPCAFHVSENNKCAAHVLNLFRAFNNSFSLSNSTFLK